MVRFRHSPLGLCLHAIIVLALLVVAAYTLNQRGYGTLAIVAFVAFLALWIAFCTWLDWRFNK